VKTSYSNLPVVQYRATLLPFDEAKKILLKLTDVCTARAVFGILYAEASKKNNSFVSAGNYNYAGVQTDSGKWGYDKPITGRFARVDSGKRLREFASFNNNTGFLDFMVNRIKAKQFNGCNSSDWTNTYIQRWWSPSAKKQYLPGTEKFNQKKSIYLSAQKKFDAITITNQKKISNIFWLIPAVLLVTYILKK